MSQHMEALERANEVRVGRAELKRRIKAGAASVVGVLDDIPSEAGTMTVAELLRAQERWGSRRARRFLAPLGIRENRRVADLTERQRRQLATALTGRGSIGARQTTTA